MTTATIPPLAKIRSVPIYCSWHCQSVGLEKGVQKKSVFRTVAHTWYSEQMTCKQHRPSHVLFLEEGVFLLFPLKIHHVLNFLYSFHFLTKVQFLVFSFFYLQICCWVEYYTTRLFPLIALYDDGWLCILQRAAFLQFVDGLKSNVWLLKVTATGSQSAPKWVYSIWWR